MSYHNQICCQLRHFPWTYALSVKKFLTLLKSLRWIKEFYKHIGSMGICGWLSIKMVNSPNGNIIVLQWIFKRFFNQISGHSGLGQISTKVEPYRESQYTPFFYSILAMNPNLVFTKLGFWFRGSNLHKSKITRLIPRNKDDNPLKVNIWLFYNITTTIIRCKVLQVGNFKMVATWEKWE